MNCIFVKTELIQRYFSRISQLPGIPYNFLRIEQTPTTLSSTVFRTNKTLSDIVKKLIHQIVERQLKVWKSQIQYSIEKINRNFQTSKINKKK